MVDEVDVDVTAGAVALLSDIDDEEFKLELKNSSK